MKEIKSSLSVNDSSRYEQPGIGLIAQGTDVQSAEIVETVEKISANGRRILVAIDDTDQLTRRKLASTAAICVTSSTSDSDPETELTRVAKQRGLPGLILHPEPTGDGHLDYNESVKTYYNSESYLVSGHLTDHDVGTPHVAVILATEHDIDTISTFARITTSHVDELLIITESNQDSNSPSISLPTTTLAADPGKSAFRKAIEAVTRRYPSCKAVTLVGADTPIKNCEAFPELVEEVTSGEKDFVIGRATDATEATTDGESRLGRLVDRAIDTDKHPQNKRPLAAGPQIMTPAAARTIERGLDTVDSRQQLIDAAIRNELDVGMREFTPAATASTSQSPVETKYLVGPDSTVQPTLSVVMPTLNEEEGIRKCIESVVTAIETLEEPTEIIVSDSSTDRTPDIAREMGAKVVHPDEKGYGCAYRYAFKRTRGEYIVMGDADTTYDFEQIPRLLGELQEQEADMIMGSRLEGEIKPGAMPTLHQYIGNPALTTFLNLFYDAGVSDSHSGFRIFTQEAYERMELQTAGMEFASEMIMDAGQRGLDIIEVPIVYHEREGEETLDSFKDGWRHIKFMLVNAPGYLFSAPGVLLGLTGMLVMTIAATNTNISGVSLGTNSMVAGSLLTIAGYQVFTFGLFSVVGSDPIRQSRDPVTETLGVWLSLERGAVVGMAILIAGTLHASSLVAQWATSGFIAIPVTVASLGSFTAIILGIQTVFSAFFLSELAESRPQ